MSSAHTANLRSGLGSRVGNGCCSGSLREAQSGEASTCNHRTELAQGSSGRSELGPRGRDRALRCSRTLAAPSAGPANSRERAGEAAGSAGLGQTRAPIYAVIAPRGVLDHSGLSAPATPRRPAWLCAAHPQLPSGCVYSDPVSPREEPLRYCRLQRELGQAPVRLPCLVHVCPRR